MRAKRCRRLLICLLLSLIILIAAILECDSRIRVILNNYAQSNTNIIANRVINRTVNEYLEEAGITYGDLVKINSAGEGKVTSVEFDTVTITKIQSGLISQIQNNILKEKEMSVSIPIGTVTGSQFLNNRGPKINIRFEISPAVKTKISSKFTSAGINQTMHQIQMSVSADIYFVMPWYRSSGRFETEYILAETVIVGEVPEAYTNVIEYPGSDMAGYLFDYGAEQR